VEQIHETAAVVFQADGYRHRLPAKFFEKEGTLSNTRLTMASLLRKAVPSLSRSRGTIWTVAPAVCNAMFMVKSAGDSFFEEEHRIANIAAGHTRN
jgi:hypothetical protein